MQSAQEVQRRKMSSQSITYFMWKYQPNFRAAAKYFAERVFKVLDQLFEPQLFLVGIRADNNPDRFPACVEPEKDFWIHSERFNSVLRLAQTLIQAYPEAGMVQSHPLAQEQQDNALSYRPIPHPTRDPLEM